MKLQVFSVLSLLCVGATFQQFTVGAQVTVEWSNFPGGVSVAVDAQHNSYSANWDYNPAGDITLTKRNSAGNILWETGFDNTDATRHEVATWVEVDSEQNVLVSGTIRSGFSNPVNAASVLMKFSPAGDLIWRHVYESNFDGSSTKKCLVDAFDNIYVLGLGMGPNGLVTKVKKFAPDGTSVWNYFDSAGIGAPLNFKLTPDNALVISAKSVTGSFNGYAKIDQEGNQIWSLVGINSLTAGDIAGDAFGNSYMINGQFVVQNAGSVLTKLDPSGATVWTHTNTMAGNRVEVGTDHQAVISGFPTSGSAGAAFMKYDTEGGVLWQNLNADGPSVNLLLHAQLKMDPLNAAYLVAGNLFQMGVCKVNPDGTAGWTALVGTGGGVCMDFGPDYNVYVTGGTTAKLGQTVVIPSGCTDFNACNYNSAAIVDDGSCVYPGCTIPEACNYNPLAGCSDDSCEFSSCQSPCAGDFDNNGLVNFSDFNFLLGQFGCLEFCSADLNGDDAVDFADLLIIQVNFGLLCP